MKNRFVWAGVLALAIGALSQVETRAVYTNLNGTIITNGTIIVTTRAAGDGHFFLQSSSTIDDMDDNQGPGCSPGDVAMCELLQDNGYATKLVPDKALSYFIYPFSTSGNSPCLDVFGNPDNPQLYYQGYCGPADTSESPQYNELLSAMLVVVSGSGSSSDAIQPNTNGIPIVIGENAILGASDFSVPGGHGEHFLYSHKTGNNYANSNPTNGDLYMKVLLPNHPIMQGIPLVSCPIDTNRTYVKIIRDPYPNENAHLLPPINSASHANYDVSTTYMDISAGNSVPAPGLQVIGVLASHTNYAIFATMERGATLADTTHDQYSPWYNYTVAPARMVHFFVNEQGSHKSRRNFNALSVWGRILFLRACQWAMEENVQPFQSLGVIDISLVSPSTVRLGWTGSSQNNYRIDGTASLINPNWVPIVDSIVNNGDGVRVTRTLNMASAPQAVFMRVAQLP
jgi:hypothetical protein